LFASPISAELYFLTFPNAPTAEQIAGLARSALRECGLKGRPLQTSRFHVSLHHLAEYDPQQSLKTFALKGRAAAATVRTSPFAVMFNRIESFSSRNGRYPLVLRGDDGVVGLEMFHRSLGMAMRFMGLKARLHCTPHLTLSYGDRRIKEHFVEPVSWTVREFWLILSLHGISKYVPLGRWKLDA
jgi:RNA 2',3'-cyclic 3'-phosphodiesterase